MMKHGVLSVILLLIGLVPPSVVAQLRGGKEGLIRYADGGYNVARRLATYSSSLSPDELKARNDVLAVHPEASSSSLTVETEQDTGFIVVKVKGNENAPIVYSPEVVRLFDGIAVKQEYKEKYNIDVSNFVDWELSESNGVKVKIQGSRKDDDGNVNEVNEAQHVSPAGVIIRDSAQFKSEMAAYARKVAKRDYPGMVGEPKITVHPNAAVSVAIVLDSVGPDGFSKTAVTEYAEDGTLTYDTQAEEKKVAAKVAKKLKALKKSFKESLITKLKQKFPGGKKKPKNWFKLRNLLKRVNSGNAITEKKIGPNNFALKTTIGGIEKTSMYTINADGRVLFEKNFVGGADDMPKKKTQMYEDIASRRDFPGADVKEVEMAANGRGAVVTVEDQSGELVTVMYDEFGSMSVDDVAKSQAKRKAIEAAIEKVRKFGGKGPEVTPTATYNEETGMLEVKVQEKLNEPLDAFIVEYDLALQVRYDGSDEYKKQKEAGDAVRERYGISANAKALDSSVPGSDVVEYEVTTENGDVESAYYDVRKKLFVGKRVTQKNPMTLNQNRGHLKPLQLSPEELERFTKKTFAAFPDAKQVQMKSSGNKVFTMIVDSDGTVTMSTHENGYEIRRDTWDPAVPEIMIVTDGEGSAVYKRRSDGQFYNVAEKNPSRALRNLRTIDHYSDVSLEDQDTFNVRLERMRDAARKAYPHVKNPQVKRIGPNLYVTEIQERNKKGAVTKTIKIETDTAGSLQDVKVFGPDGNRKRYARKQLMKIIPSAFRPEETEANPFTRSTPSSPSSASEGKPDEDIVEDDDCKRRKVNGKYRCIR